MRRFLEQNRALIAEALAGYLSRKRDALAAVNPLGPQSSDMLLDFVLQGKMLRGCLVALGHRLCGGDPGPAPRSAIEAGAAMELIQSGLLIHDDIMDRDLLRRGKATIFQQYAEAASRDGRSDARHLGESLGICAGDVAFFLAFELLSTIHADPVVVVRATALCSRELAAVGIAQMQDVSWGASESAVEEDDILRLYTYKTSRYTFSVPLMVGALLAGAEERQIALLERIGENLGILFQIRDDELGLFGDERELGKPVGSDVREGKKTLYASFLLRTASPEERRLLDAIFGNREGSTSDLELVRRLAQERGAKDRVGSIARRLETGTRAMIDDMPPENREILGELLEYTTARTR